MATSFSEIQERAGEHWREMNADRPWVRVGTALCGQAAGAGQVADAIEEELAQKGLSAQVSRVGCLGLCFAEPLVDVQLPGRERVFYANVSPESVREIVSSHIELGQPVKELVLGCLGERELDDLPELDNHPMRVREQRIALRNAGHIDPLDIYQYVANGGYLALNRALTEMSAADVLEEVNVSGLRGRGGAAFPAGTKWRFLARLQCPGQVHSV